MCPTFGHFNGKDDRCRWYGITLDNVMFGDNHGDFWIPLFTYHDAFACSTKEKVTFEF